LVPTERGTFILTEILDITRCINKLQVSLRLEKIEGTLQVEEYIFSPVFPVHVAEFSE